MSNSNCISVTQNFKKELLNSFLDYLSSPSENSWFIAIGNPIPWSFDRKVSQNGQIYQGDYSDASDFSVPTSLDNDSEKSNFHRTCIAMKKIDPKDVSFLIEKILWSKNTVYTPYRYDEEMFLPNKKFYALVESNKRVYKCIENIDYGISASSTTGGAQIEPTSNSLEIIDTNDGYKWKLMYQLNTADELKFTIDGRGEADSYIPVSFVDFNPIFTNQTDGYSLQKSVQENAVSGSLSSIYINSIYNKQYQLDENYCAFGENSVFLKSDAAVGATSVNIDYFGNNSIANSLENMAFYVVDGDGSGQLRRIKSSYRSSNSLFLEIDPLFEGLKGYIDGNSNESEINILPYVRIIGDGTARDTTASKDDNLKSALAKVVYDDENYIRGVDLLDIGKNYTYANSRIDKGIILETGSTGNSLSTLNVPTDYLKTSLSPQGGHGSNAVSELGASKILLKISLDGTEGGKLNASNDFRQIAIIKNPTFRTTTIKLRTNSATSGVSVGDEVSIGSGVTGTILSIYQYSSGGEEIVLNNVEGDIGNITSIGSQNIRDNDGLEVLTVLGSENKKNQILKSTTTVSDISSSIVLGVGNSQAGIIPSYASGRVEKVENLTEVHLDTVRGQFKDNEKVIVIDPSQGFSLNASEASFIVEDISDYTSNSVNSIYKTSTILTLRSAPNQLFDSSSFTRDTIVYSFEDNTVQNILSTTPYKNNAFVFDWESQTTSTFTISSNEYNTGTLEIIGSPPNSFEVGDYILYYKNGSIQYALINSVVEPDVLYGSGDILYVQNFSGIERYQGSSEEINLVLGL